MTACSTDAAVKASVALLWLSPLHAAAYLGVSLSDLLPLVESGKLTLRRAPDHGLRFHRDDLDAVLLPVPPAQAVRLLTAEVSSNPQENMTPSDSTSSQVPATSTLVPLKDAALQLKMPYKTLLRLVHAGKIPTTNLGTSSRPRFVVDPEVIKHLWADTAQRDMRKRTAPVAAIDYSRLLNIPRKGGKVVPHG